MVGCCKLSLYANESCDEHAIHFRRLKWRAHVNHFFDIWQWCNFSAIEAFEFSCIYTRVQAATLEVFLGVSNTRTKSIQKQIKSIDVDKVGSKNL